MSVDGGLLAGLLESSLGTGAEARFVACGRSMIPLIRPGDRVTLRPPDGRAPRPGDVVAVRGDPGSAVVVHRVVRAGGGRFLVRGDNTAVANGEFAQADLLAIVSVVERDGRQVWFGAGRWGRPIAWAVRAGLIVTVNRAVLSVRRSGRAGRGRGSG